VSESNAVLINDNIRPYLNEIAERLWTSPSHAAIMVGAGFSKNANKNFPDWTTLGDLFFEKIHGRKPDKDKGEDRYLNALKLADEVQAAFGRQVLNQLLRSHIPDKDSEPSPLHIQLLGLPWSDVFTTNYDTLLDRACDSVLSQKFDVVVNKEDLVYSEKPRIIKLHGSFPSERPFIITEEDYRTYPKEFAPFVNTVQQSLLENTLCLIGFSGDDPNFLQWIGWIRDNLGKENSPKIYLIGLFNLSDAQIKLLDHRNIVLVDLGECPDVDGNHYAALERFFNYLSSRKKEDNRLGWPENPAKLSPDISIDKTIQTEEIIKKWQHERLQYPRWLIVPEDRRQNLWISTKSWISFLSNNDGLPEELVLGFCYELNWRLEHCLYPIPNNVSELFEKVLENYWLFIEQKPSINNGDELHYLNNNNHINMCLSLGLSMLRFYREDGLFEQWEDINNKLDSLIENLLQEQVAFLYYERALYSLFKLDISQVKQQLSIWPTNFSIPFWETKRAGILAEIGRAEEAEKILDRALREIRSKLNLKPVLSDYSLVSEEASTMLLLQYVKGRFEKKSWNIEQAEEIRHQFSKRFDVLMQYKCDPWNEIKLFENQLNSIPVGITDISKKYEFDIGRVTQTHHFNEDTEAITSYNLLRFFESSGFPFRIPGATLCKKGVKSTLQRISKYSPYWATATLMRIGDAQVADEIFNRQALLDYSLDKTNKLIDEYLIILGKVDTEISNVNNSFGILLAQIVPEILSRLCCRCSNDRKLRLLEFLTAVYGSKYKHHYLGIKNLFNRLMASFSPMEQFQLIPKILEVPYPENMDSFTGREFLNPFHFISDARCSPTKTVVLNNDKLEMLYELAVSKREGKRKWATFSLIRLHKFNLVPNQHADKIGDILWSQIGDGDFPAKTDFYKFAFLKLPHPEQVKPSVLLKSYIKNTGFLVQPADKEKVVSSTGSIIPLCNEIIGAGECLERSQEEIQGIFKSLIMWWDVEKSYLKNEKPPSLLGPALDEFKQNFIRFIGVLLTVIFPNLQITSSNKDQTAIVKQIIDELEEYGLYIAELKASAFCYQQYDKKLLFFDIDNGLSSKKHGEVVDALRAISLLLKENKRGIKSSIAKHILLVGQIIRWNREVALIPSLNTVEFIIKEHPAFFSNELEIMCLHGIRMLVVETSLKRDFSEEEFFNRLKLRKVVARTAYQLSIYYDKKQLEIPEEVLLWKDICASDSEFSEIKVQWESE